MPALYVPLHLFSTLKSPALGHRLQKTQPMRSLRCPTLSGQTPVGHDRTTINPIFFWWISALSPTSSWRAQPPPCAKCTMGHNQSQFHSGVARVQRERCNHGSSWLGHQTWIRSLHFQQLEQLTYMSNISGNTMVYQERQFQIGPTVCGRVHERTLLTSGH